MKNVLKRLARTVGYDIVRYADPAPVNPFDVLSLIVDNLVLELDMFTFVQIGANDGLTIDPLRDLVTKHKLHGLLVEPLPDLFEKLKKNYTGQPGLTFDRCAIGPTNGEGVLYRVKTDAPVPAWAQLLASFNRAHLTQKLDFPGADAHIEAVTVPMLTVQSLLKKHGLSDPTLLQIDTEGFDAEIVRMTLENGIRPRIIQYEHEHIRLPERTACKSRLLAAGYTFVDVGLDTIAMLPDQKKRSDID